MAVIDKNLNCIFVHIFRTGGNSVRPLLGAHFDNKELLGWHVWARDVHRHFMKNDPEFWESAYKFSFVRNPFDWVVSTWQYTKYTGHEDRKIIESMTFAQYLKWAIENRLNVERPFGSNRFTTLTKFLCDENGKLLVDFVGHTETIATDMAKICQHLKINFKGIPHKNANNRREYRDYRRYYNKETKTLVEKYWAEDFEQFGYAW